MALSNMSAKHKFTDVKGFYVITAGTISAVEFYKVHKRDVFVITFSITGIFIDTISKKII